MCHRPRAGTKYIGLEYKYVTDGLFSRLKQYHPYFTHYVQLHYKGTTLNTAAFQSLSLQEGSGFQYGIYTEQRRSDMRARITTSSVHCGQALSRDTAMTSMH